MDLKARIRGWLGIEQFNVHSPDMRMRTVMVGSNPIYMYFPDGFNSAEADRRDPNLSRAVKVIGDSIAGLPILLKRRVIVDGDETLEDADDHPAGDLLRRPNELLRSDEIIRHIIQSLINAGNGYWYLELSGKTPKAIWPIIPGVLRPKYNDLKIPIGYVKKEERGEMFLKLEEVVHFRFYDMRTPFEGRNLVEPIADELACNKYALDLHKAVFQQGILSDRFLIDNTLGGMKDDDIKRMRETLMKRFGGVEHGGQFPMLPQGVDVKDFPRNVKDMLYGEMTRTNREQIYGSVGIPPTVGGVDEYASYANAMIEARNFWTNTLIPFNHNIELTVKHQYLDRFWPDDDLVVVLDTSKVPALQDDGLKKAQEHAIYIRSGERTVNELRAIDGLPKVEWGDEPPKQNIGLLPGDDPNDKDIPQKQSYASFGRPMDRTAAWFSFNKVTTKAENDYAPILRRYFKAQRGRILKAIDRVTGGGAFMSAIYFATKPEDADSIFDITTENIELEGAIKPFFEKTAKAAGNNAVRIAKDLKIIKGGSFDLNNPRVAEIIATQVNRSKKINDATFDDIKRVLADAYDNNWSQSQLVKEINQLYGDYGYTRAELIARSEMASAINQSSVESYRQNSIEYKEWLTSMDEATRDAHAEADGQIVAIDQPFIVDGEMLDAPGDPRGRPDNTINCRCTVLPALAAA